jgi:hypothetical protein
MNYFRSCVIFLTGLIAGSMVMSVQARGYPTTLEVVNLILMPLAAIMYARLIVHNGRLW